MSGAGLLIWLLWFVEILFSLFLQTFEVWFFSIWPDWAKWSKFGSNGLASHFCESPMCCCARENKMVHSWFPLCRDTLLSSATSPNTFRFAFFSVLAFFPSVCSLYEVTNSLGFIGKEIRWLEGKSLIACLKSWGMWVGWTWIQHVHSFPVWQMGDFKWNLQVLQAKRIGPRQHARSGTSCFKMLQILTSYVSSKRGQTNWWKKDWLWTVVCKEKISASRGPKLDIAGNQGRILRGKKKKKEEICLNIYYRNSSFSSEKNCSLVVFILYRSLSLQLGLGDIPLILIWYFSGFLMSLHLRQHREILLKYKLLSFVLSSTSALYHRPPGRRDRLHPCFSGPPKLQNNKAEFPHSLQLCHVHFHFIRGS